MRLLIDSGEAYPVFWIEAVGAAEAVGAIVEVPDEQAQRWFEVIKAYRKVQREIEKVDEAYWQNPLQRLHHP